MFLLHDTTRRRIAIAMFVLVCLVPTALVLAWGIARQLPWHVRREADRLSAALGLKVALAGLRHVRPGTVYYQGLELFEPETGSRVLHCARVEAVRRTTTDANGQTRESVALTLVEPEIAADQLAQVGRLAHRLLVERGARPGVEFQWTAAEAIVRAGDGPLVLGDLQGQTESQPGWSQAQTSFRLAPSQQSEPARIRLVRNRQVTPPATGFELDTGAAYLACPALAAALPGVERLGPRSRFRGNLWAHETPEGWAGQFQGTLVDVALDGLLADRLPSTLSGLARIDLETARFRQGRLEEVKGSVAAGPGMAGRWLIDAAVERLGLRGGVPTTASVSQVRYEQLAVAFFLDSRGLWLAGQCGAEDSRAILVDRYNVLLGEPAAQPLPIAAVVQALAPSNDPPVPLTRQTAWLMRHLPLPSDEGRGTRK
jgi:hypothetical protein